MRVTEKLSDHRKSFAEGETHGRKAVTQVMDSNVVEPGPGADAAPGLLEMSEVRTGLLTDDDPRVVLWTGKGGQHGHRGAGERYHPRAGLGVGETKKLKRISGLFRIPHSAACILPKHA